MEDQQQQQQQQQQVDNNENNFVDNSGEGNNNNNNEGNGNDNMTMEEQQNQTMQNHMNEMLDMDDDQSNLIVNYVPPQLSEDDFRALFDPYGKIESCKLLMERYSGRSMGYGFVKYSNGEEAARSIEALNGKPFMGKTLKVSVARPPSSQIKGANLYIANLPIETDDSTLKQMFCPYGVIIEVKILVGPDGASKGVGFVRYDTKQEAQAAIAALNNWVPPNQSKALLVKFAETQQDKQRRQRGNYMRQQQTNPMYQRFNPMGGVQPQGHHQGQPQQVFQHYAMMGQGQQNGGMGGQPQVNQTPMPDSRGKYTLFIYNLPATADDRYLYALFSSFGQVEGVKAVRDAATGQCKGYGFASFATPQPAQVAIANLNGFIIPETGKQLQVSFKTEKK